MEYQIQSGHVMNLANSIIGVSVLAMPYCFKQCGIVLSIFMLCLSSIISRLACHFLLKSAIITRRKTFEFLAFNIFGSLGKLAVEIGIIGFLLGTCIAFFVVMGDLGPELINEISGSALSSSTMRSSILMALALFCVLPLGLLRDVDSLNGVSKATIGFYCCLILKVVFEAAPHIFNGDWINYVTFWNTTGLLQCLPIFSMALFCQTQIFEIYQALPNATLEKMNNLVRVAVNICTCVYIFVGLFGYIAFAHKPFTGNILLSFSPSVITDVLKLGFIMSVAFSFPLVIFPCRASLYSLLYKEAYGVHDPSNYIPEGKFKGLTLLIVFVSLIIGIMIPNIEIVLGLMGSTIGVMVCVLFPVTCFICIYPKNTNERLLAKAMLIIGIVVMVLGTYRNIYGIANESVKIEPAKVEIKVPKISFVEVFSSKPEPVVEKKKILAEIPPAINLPPIEPKIDIKKEVRHEPPQPEEPQEPPIKPKKIIKPVTETINLAPILSEIKLNKTHQNKSIVQMMNAKKTTEESIVDIEAIKKEENEQKIESARDEYANQVLIDAIHKQNEVQQEIVKQQEKLIQVIKEQQSNNQMDEVKKEKLEAVKQIQNIALKAIESIGLNQDENTNKNAVVDKKVEVVAPSAEPPKILKHEVSEKKLNETAAKLSYIPLPLLAASNLSHTVKNKSVPSIVEVPPVVVHKINDES